MHNAPLRGTNTQAIIRSEAKGACVFVSQRAPASDYSGLLEDDVSTTFGCSKAKTETHSFKPIIRYSLG